MNSPLRDILVVAAASCWGLVFVGACGDGTSAEQNQQGDECTEDTVAQDCAAGEICVDGLCSTDSDTNSNDETTGDFVEPAPHAPSCVDESPERCDVEDFGAFAFGPGSFLEEVRIPEGDCCIDFTGSGEFTDDPDEVDNSLPDMIGIMYDLDGANQFIAGAIEGGSFGVALEHDGLQEDQTLETGDTYDLNVLFTHDAPEDGGVAIDTVSFEQGAHPYAVLPDAEIVDGDGGLQVHAGPTTVDLKLDVGAFLEEVSGVELDLTISNAELLADVVATEVDGGLELANGRIGGVVRLDDIVDTLNSYIQTCDCLHNPDSLVDLGDTEDDGQCLLDEVTRDLGENNCGFGRAEEVCRDLAKYCDAIPVMDHFADIDTTGDELPDAFSAGIRFSAVPVEITSSW